MLLPLLLLLLLLLASSVAAAGQSHQRVLTIDQQMTCYGSHSRRPEQVGEIAHAGCPLTLRRRPWSPRGADPLSREILLEPAACVTRADLLEAATASPLYNPVRGQFYFQLRLRLHHPEFVAAAIAAVISRSVVPMIPTEASVGLEFRPRNFTVDNARLVSESSGNSWSVLVGIYCTKERDCRTVQAYLQTKPEYIVEILELRLTVREVNGCYKTLKTSQKVSLMTENLGNASRNQDQPAEVEFPGLQFNKKCDEKMNRPVTLTTSGREHLARIRRMLPPGSDFSVFNFRRSCQNLAARYGLKAAQTLGRATLVGDSRRLHRIGVRLTTGGRSDTWIAIPLTLPPRVNLLGTYVRYMSLGNSTQPADNQSLVTMVTIDCPSIAPNGTAVPLACLLADDGGSETCSLDLVNSGGRGQSTKVTEHCDSWRLRIGAGRSFRDYVSCVAVAWTTSFLRPSDGPQRASFLRQLSEACLVS